MNLVQGQQHIKVSDLVGEVELFELKMTFTDWRINFNCVIGFDDNGLVADDYLIYDTRTETPCHGIVLKSFIAKNPLFDCQLNLIPNHINRLLFKVNIPCSIQFSECCVDFCVQEQVISTFRFTNENSDVELGEFHREEGIWYFSTNVEKLSKELADIVHEKRFLIDLAKDPDSFGRHQEAEKKENSHKQLLDTHAGKNGFMLSPANIDILFKVHKHYMNHSEAFIMKDSMFSQKIPSKGNRLLVMQSYEPIPYLKDTKGRYITLEMKNENKSIEKARPRGNDNYTVAYNEQRNTYQFFSFDFPFEIPKLSPSEIEDCYFEVTFSDEIEMEFNGKSTHSKLFNKNKTVDILIRDNKIISLKQGTKLVKIGESGVFNADTVLRSYNFFDFYPQRVILNNDGEFWLLLRYMFRGLNIYEHLEVIKRIRVMNDKFEVYEIYKRVTAKKKRKLGIYLPNKNKIVSILFIKHSPYSSSPSYLFPEHFCQYEYDMELAEKEAKKEKTRLAGEKREISKELENANDFHKKMHCRDGAVISIKNLKVLYSIYNYFMNKSDVFILHNSRFIHHRLSSKGDNLLVFNMDLSSLITDKDGNPVSLYLNHCRDEMKHLNLFEDFALIIEGKDKYYLEDTAMVFQVDKLSEEEREDHSFDVELFDESYIEIKSNFINILKQNSSAPIDFIIIDNKLTSVQQGAIVQNLDGSIHLNKVNANLILRCHNFYFFRRKFFFPIKEHFIIKNGDGEYWLLSQGEYSLQKQSKYGKPTSYPFKIYEHLEVLRNF